METGIDIIAIIPYIIVANVVSAIACNVIADARGVSSRRWLLLGFLFNFLAVLFVSIALPNEQKKAEDGFIEGTHKKCNYCAEIVKAEAVKCRYCHSPLETKEPPQEEPNNSQTDDSQTPDNTAS